MTNNNVISTMRMTNTNTAFLKAPAPLTYQAFKIPRLKHKFPRETQAIKCGKDKVAVTVEIHNGISR